MSLYEDIKMDIKNWLIDFNISQRTSHGEIDVPEEDVDELLDAIMRSLFKRTDAQIERDRDEGK